MKWKSNISGNCFMNNEIQEKSFAAKAKDEICLISADLPTCCYHAMSYGLLLCGRSFSSSSMMIVTEHEGTALLYAQAVGSIIGVQPPVKVSESGKYSVSVSDKADRLKVLSAFGISEKTVSVRINRANIADECCHAAFVRGAFLGCATLTSPQKSYQLEFLLPYLHLADDLLNLLQELNVAPKMVRRRSSYVIYIKKSEVIEDLLMTIGAQKSALEIMEIKIEKDMRNKINRKVNFETANIDRSVAAATEQREAIRKLKADNRFDDLPDELKELARLREEYPEASLKELGSLLSVSLSRSGIYHRLNKIVSIANSAE